MVVTAAFIVFGLATKLAQSINMGLNSDMVGEGLQAMEIWKHHNYLLAGYYLPSQDTFLFTELLPFQLIPQILTGYDPLALKAMTFVMFTLAVIVISYIVYLVSDSAACALLFAALAANMPARGYVFLALPSSHAGAMVFLGIIFALLLYLGKNERAWIEKGKKGRKTRPAAYKIQWAYVAGLAILVTLTVLSDTIALTWLIIPYVLAYVFLYKGKTPTMNIAVSCMVALSALAYVFKTYFVYNWVVQDVLTRRETADIISVNLPLYFRSLATVLNQGLYSITYNSGFGVLEALSLVAFAGALAYAAKNAAEDRSKRFFYGVLLASAFIMFALYLVSGYTIDESNARYLTFTALTAFMLIAISYKDDNKLYGALILALLLVSAILGYTYVSGLDGRTNAQEYGLISYLKDNNLTFGYGTYWNSNVITYLSGEDVTVRAAFFYRDDLRPNVWLACERWYRSTPDRSFILVDNSSLDDNGREVTRALMAKLNASEALHYGKYDIYPLENYHIAPFQVIRQ